MPGTPQLFAVSLLAILAAGCVGNAHIDFDEKGDLSKYRTWSWLVRNSPTVDATPGAGPASADQLARLIEQKMDDNGFRHVDSDPDFYVTFQLIQRRRLLDIDEPSAIYELSSLHASPSYVIEGNRVVTHLYSELRLAIAAIRAGAGTLWQATFSQFEREHYAMKLDEAAAILLERLPRHSAENDERRRAACAGKPSQRRAKDAVDGRPELPCPEKAPASPREPRSKNFAPA